MPHRRLAALGLFAASVVTSACAPGTEIEVARERFSKEVGCALNSVSAAAQPELSAHDMTFGANASSKEVRAKYDADNHVYLLTGCNQKKYYACRRGEKNRLQCPPMNVAR